MPTRTLFVLLTHPKEFKREKAGTGRLTHLCLPDSRILMGTEFDQHAELQAVLRDPAHFPVLLYPGPTARNLSRGDLRPEDLGGRRLVVLALDATWACARKMLRLSPTLQALPRIMFTPGAPSRFVIKQQPQEGCLSTLEAVHETLLALERSGLDAYADRAQLPDLFERMQNFQIACALDPARGGYRRKPYSAPGERSAGHGRSAMRRSAYLGRPEGRPGQEPTREPAIAPAVQAG